MPLDAGHLEQVQHGVEYERNDLLTNNETITLI